MIRGELRDVSPCYKCQYKNKLTVESPCYSCIDLLDLALHKPNSETEFANFKPINEAEKGRL